ITGVTPQIRHQRRLLRERRADAAVFCGDSGGRHDGAGTGVGAGANVRASVGTNVDTNAGTNDSTNDSATFRPAFRNISAEVSGRSGAVGIGSAGARLHAGGAP